MVGPRFTMLPQPGLDKVAQQHARKAKACGVQKAHTAIDLEFIMGVVPPAHVEELFHDPAREVFKDRRDDRTEDEREHRILEATVQKIQHEQRAMAVNGAEKAVEEASLFADVTLGDGAVEHLAAPAEGAVRDVEQKQLAEVFRSWKAERACSVVIQFLLYQFGIIGTGM